jgi:hypothetical protein
MLAKSFYSLQERSHEIKKELVSYVEYTGFSYSSIPQQQQQIEYLFWEFWEVK